jgi:predicted secreted protein
MRRASSTSRQIPVRVAGRDVQAVALHDAYAIDMPAQDTLTRRRERIAGIHRLSIDTIELYERNTVDELALRLVHGELPVVVDKREELRGRAGSPIRR